MYADHEVAVVVPAFEESGFVGDVLGSIPAYVDRVYAVDDRSTDDTWREIRTSVGRAAERAGSAPGRWKRPDSGPLAERVDRARRGGRLVAIRHARNYGPGGAVKTGYLAALTGTADVVATIDGDGQMDPAMLDRFLDPLVEGAAGYVTGTRFQRRGDLREMPPFRRFGNGVLTSLSRGVTGYWDLSDPVNGYTAATADALERIDVGEIYEGYGYGIGVLAAMNVAGVVARDVPHPSHYGDETSSIRYSQYIPRVSRLLLANGIRRLRRQHPGAAGGAGAALGRVLATVARRPGAVADDGGTDETPEARPDEGRLAGDAEGQDLRASRQ